MSATAGAGNFAERVRAAVACYRAVQPEARGVFVVAEYLPLAREYEPPGGGPSQPRVARRLLIRRVYAGSNKALEERHTIVVGYDLGDREPRLVAVPFPSRSVELTVSSTSPLEIDARFEGVFDLRTVELKATPT